MPIETQPQVIAISTPRANPSAAASSPKGRRIAALDFTKGALVLIMVLYHWINYFLGPQWKYYPYLRFLTPSFIFISGFMISHVYLVKYAATDGRLPRRLFTRGLKLLAVFLVLNLARNVVVPLLGTGVAAQSMPSLSTLFTVFVSGNLPVVTSKMASFAILVPIGYLLMLAGLLVLPYRLFRYTFHVVCAALLLSVAILAFAGMRSYNLEFIAIGMLGVLSGFLPQQAIERVTAHPIVLAFAYLAYVGAVTVWNVPFALLVVGVFLSLSILYFIGSGKEEAGVVRSEVILLGKYSLLGYIAQVGILQILRASFNRVDLGLWVLPVSFILAFLLTIVTIEIVDRSRAKAASIDKLYKAVFA